MRAGIVTQLRAPPETQCIGAETSVHHRWNTRQTLYSQLTVQSTSPLKFWMSAEFIFTLSFTQCWCAKDITEAHCVKDETVDFSTPVTFCQFHHHGDKTSYKLSLLISGQPVIYRVSSHKSHTKNIFSLTRGILWYLLLFTPVGDINL